MDINSKNKRLKIIRTILIVGSILLLILNIYCSIIENKILFFGILTNCAILFGVFLTNKKTNKIK